MCCFCNLSEINVRFVALGDGMGGAYANNELKTKFPPIFQTQMYNAVQKKKMQQFFNKMENLIYFVI